MGVSEESINEAGIKLPTSLGAYNKMVTVLDIIHESIDFFGVEKEVTLDADKLEKDGAVGKRELGAILENLMNGKILTIMNIVAPPLDKEDAKEPDNWHLLTYAEYLKNDYLSPFSFTIKIIDNELFIDFMTYIKSSKTQMIANQMALSKISLAGKKVMFDDNEPAILINSRKCILPPFRNEHYFCRAMFEHMKNEAIDWSVIYRKMNGHEPKIGDERKDKKMVSDTMRAVNIRVRECLNTEDDFFRWSERTVIRNF